MLQVDYAENHTCRAQDEVQSAHWNQAQVKLHTSVSWFRGQIDPQVAASDTCQHNKSTVALFTDRIFSAKSADVTQMNLWTDGQAIQEPICDDVNEYVI